MTSCLRHRGPDDEGYYTDGAAHLGMVRLSIIDVAGGHQPMSEEQGYLHVIFNGEIYNYAELREELIAKGHTLKTHSDTEVIVHWYEEEQEKCLARFNGDFSISIWDARKKELFLARDRLGVKPLYYWHDGARFAFASELKALLLVADISRELDYQAVDAFLTFLYIPSPRTIFQAVKKLPAGYWLKFSAGFVSLQSYWQLPSALEQKTVPDDEAAAEIRNRLRQAVHRRLVSEVPLGVFLSGGIDSSAVLALMREKSTRPVETFSLGFEQPYDTYNELPAARLTAAIFGAKHHAFVVKPDIARLLPEMVWHLDEPHADSSALLTFLLCRQTRGSVTVALTGIGGDELFGGYPRYLAMRLSQRCEQWPFAIRRELARLAGFIRETNTARNTPGRIKRFLRGLALSAEDRYLLWISHLSLAARQALYQPSFLAALNEHSAWANFRQVLNMTEGSYLDRISQFDMETYLPDDLLMLADKMSMAHGLELRVPFCDHELAEYVFSLPMQQRLQGGQLKGLLKSALKDELRPELLSRRKQGFMLPLASWLRGPLSGLCDEWLSPDRVAKRGFLNPQAVTRLIRDQRAGQSTLSHLVYALLVFELWCQRYWDGN